MPIRIHHPQIVKHGTMACRHMNLGHRYTSKVRCTCKMPKVSHRLIYDLYWRCGVKGRRVTDVIRYACKHVLHAFLCWGSCKTFPCIRGHICETIMLSINRIMFSFIVSVCSNLAYFFPYFVANFCLSLYLDCT